VICRSWERIVTVPKVTFQETEKWWDSHDGLMVDRDLRVLWKEAAVFSLGLCSSISLDGLRKHTKLVSGRTFWEQRFQSESSRIEDRNA
jgi:hypothetical protein